LDNEIKEDEMVKMRYVARMERKEKHSYGVLVGNLNRKDLLEEIA
jgi:hypothetical protein